MAMRNKKNADAIQMYLFFRKTIAQENLFQDLVANFGFLRI